VVQVIGIVAKNKLTLATGHSSPAEALMIIREAKRQGVEHIVVTHATNRFVGMSVPEMKEAAQLGAMLEFVWVRPGTAAVADSAKAIREVGPAFCILSSDLGQASNPPHPTGLQAFFDDLKKQGITDSEIALMSRTNPAKIARTELDPGRRNLPRSHPTKLSPHEPLPFWEWIFRNMECLRPENTGQ
jgi:hypothetical protein